MGQQWDCLQASRVCNRGWSRRSAASPTTVSPTTVSPTAVRQLVLRHRPAQRLGKLQLVRRRRRSWSASELLSEPVAEFAVDRWTIGAILARGRISLFGSSLLERTHITILSIAFRLRPILQ